MDKNLCVQELNKGLNISTEENVNMYVQHALQTISLGLSLVVSNITTWKNGVKYKLSDLFLALKNVFFFITRLNGIN